MMNIIIKINGSDVELVKSLLNTDEIPEFGETIVFDNGIELTNMTHIKNRFGSLEEFVLEIVIPAFAKEALSILLKPLIDYLKTKLGSKKADVLNLNITVNEHVNNIHIDDLEEFILNEAEKEKH